VLPLKLALMFAFALLSGNCCGFMICAILDELEARKRMLLGIGSFILYSGIVLVYNDKLTSSSLAFVFAKAIMIGAFIMLVSLIKMSVNFLEQKALESKERIVKLSIEELEERKLNKKLTAQSIYVEQNARLIERENISRNIHNSVGHTITAAIMTLDAATMLYETNPDMAKEKIEAANGRMRESLDSIRRAVRTLDDTGAPIEIKDVIGAFDAIIENFTMDSEMTVNKEIDVSDISTSIEHEHAEFLTGALEEFLSNGVRHGDADTFMVHLSGDSAHIRLWVKDNGKSDFNFENYDSRIANGFGIKKIMSYVERFGGKCKFSNNNGFSSMIELPIIRRNNIE